jgi:predicted nucleic acid-binding protein
MVIVADASAVINLNATGCATEIITALPNRVAVVDLVTTELEQGRRRDRQDADLLNELVAVGLIEIVRLGEPAVPHFEELVIGPAARTLDDGEAATIAYAIAHDAIPLVDERKANRICAERFPELRVGCTVDIFTHPEMLQSLGREALADAVFNALNHGRMRVFPHHIEWVIGLIGTERAALCTSLPGSVRLTLAKAAGAKTSS